MAEALQFTIEVLGMTEDLKELGRLRDELSLNTAAQKALKKSFDDGKISSDKYREGLGTLKVQHDALASTTKVLNNDINAQATAFKGAEGSMIRMGQELGNMRVLYRGLSEEERNNAQVGGVLLANIQKQDAEIKRLDTSIGNHQRSVGNYQKIWDGLGKSMLIGGGMAGIAIMAFGGLKDAMMDGAKAAIEEESAQARLKFALNGNAEAVQRLTAWKKALFESTTFSKEDIAQMTNYGLSLGKTEVQTMDMVKAAMALSKASGGTIEPMAAMEKLQGSLQGVAKGLKQFVGDLTKEQLKNGDAITIINEKYEKFITSGLDTTAGKLTMAKKNWSEFWESLMGGAVKLFSAVYQGFKDIGNQFSFVRENFGLLAAWGNFFTGNSGVQGGQNAAYFEWKKQQLEKISLIIQENKAKQAGGAPAAGGASGGDDGSAAKAAAIEAAKLKKLLEEGLKDRANTIKSNNDYLLKLTGELLTAEANAIEDQQTRELSLEQSKFKNERTELLNNQAEKLSQIDKEIEEVKKKKGKATDEEKAQVKALEDEKYAIIASTADLITAKEEASNRAQVDIRKKYDPSTKDNAITSKYSADVAQAENDARVKLDTLKSYYATKGTLTKTELEKEKQEEDKINIELYNKKYQLLLAEITQRKALGTISEEDYKNQLQALAKLYNQVVSITQADDKKPKTGNQKFTSFIAKVFHVDDPQAAAIIQEAEQLAGKIYQTWQRMQEQRIDNELAMDEKRIQTQEDVNLASIEKQHSQGLISDQIYNARKKEIQDKADAQKKEAEKKAFEAKKEQSIIDIIINAAIGAVAAYQLGPIAGTIFAAIIAGLAIYEIAQVSAQQFVGARGGIVSGPSHAQGGKKFAVGGYVAELEGGEGVLNKKIMDDKTTYTAQGTPREIASFLNTRNGWGNGFADTSQYAPTSVTGSNQSRITDSSLGTINDLIDRKISHIKVYQVESEITKTQGDVKKIKALSTW